MKLDLDLTPAEADALAVLFSRLTFNQLLVCTHMGADEDQAYLMQQAVVKLREALSESG